MNTTENNKKIAEFMEAKYNPKQNKYLGIPLPNSNSKTNWHIDFVCYHSSWDWLMEVVERIEGLETNKQFLDRESFNHYQKVLSLPIYTPIEAVYKAVVTFIDWYNENGAKEN